MNRREVLVLAGSAAISAAVPSVPLSSATPATTIMPAWAVGTPGEWNWQAVNAPTRDAAIKSFIEEWCDGDDEQDIEADRKPQWDGKRVDAGDATWFDGGLGAYCSRCGYETFPEDGGRVVADKVVCSECMMIADWEIIDPERAVELRADLI